ncbi:MAG TPA: AAA family ATPase [Clostridia bacterium]|nr:AAA family ATPase [Clostridia bacterium]
MFKIFYGLTFNPFEKGISEKDCFLSIDHKEMLSRLNYLKDSRGIGLFTASPGMGKTYGLRCFAKTLNPNLYQMVYTCLSTISVTEFYRQFCVQLGLEPSGRKSQMYKSIQDRVAYLLKDKRKTLIFAIDESQYLSSAILRDLKMLMNYDYDSRDCFALILIGQPILSNILDKPIHEALKQRITIHYNYIGLNNEESADYLYSRLEIAGGARSIIDEAAVNAIISYSQGSPRMVNSIMTKSLMLGAQLKKQSIDTETILSASNELALR